MKYDVSVLVLKYLQSEASEKADAENYKRELLQALVESKNASDIEKAYRHVENFAEDVDVKPLEEIPEGEEESNKE